MARHEAPSARSMQRRWGRRLIPLLLVVWTIGLAVGCSSYAPPTVPVPPIPSWMNYARQARIALSVGKKTRAAELFERSLSYRPDNPTVRFELGRLYAELGQLDRARETIVAGLRSREDLTARNLLGYIYEREGDFIRAIEQFEIVAQADPNNLYALVHRGFAYQQLGRKREAIRALERARALDPKGAAPETLRVDFYLGLAYEAVEEFDKALAAYRRAEQRLPDDPYLWRRLGGLYERRGEYEKARDAYERAYDADPADETTRQRLQSLIERLNASSQGDEGTFLVPPVGIFPDDISDRILSSPTAADYPDADAVILLNRSEHEILPDGRSRFTTHQVVKLFHRRAIAKYGEVAIPFNARSQNIEVNVARTVLPDGSVVEVDDNAIHDVTPPDTLAFNLYSDLLWKVISFPALAEDVVVEYEVTIEDAHGPGTTDGAWFWGGMTFQNDYPTLASEYGLRLPRGVPFTWKVYRASIEPRITEEASRDGVPTLTYVWTYPATGVASLEPNGPPAEDVVPRLAYTSLDSWETLHDWYRDLLRNPVTVDAAISEQVGLLTGEASTQEDRMRVLAEFVAQDVRYVAIQLGQGTYQPHLAGEVLRYRYGDCKDKAILLKTMLLTIGIPSYPGLLNPDPNPDARRDLPSLGEFSHMILAVPDATAPTGYVWFDPTDATLPFGRLPARDQGRSVLLITPTGPEWVVTPIDDPDANRYEIDLTLRLAADGSASGEQRVSATGTHASDLRVTYGSISPASTKRSLEATMGPNYPGIVIERWDLSGIEDLDRPVVVDVAFRVPTYGTRGDRAWSVPIPSIDLDAQASLVAQKKRRTPLRLGVPNTVTRRVTIEPPTGYRLVEPPPSVLMKTAFGEYERTLSAGDETIVYQMTLRITQPVVPPEAYADAKRFFETVAREDRLTLRLRMTSAEAAAGPLVEGESAAYR